MTTITTGLRCTVQQDVFAAAVKAAEAALPRRTTLPVLNGVHLRVEEGSLTVTGTDLGATVRSTIPVEDAGDGEACIVGNMLADVLALMPPVPITLSCDGLAFTLRGGFQECHWTGYDPEEWPGTQMPVNGIPLTMPAAALHEALTRTAFAAATDGKQPSLNGVCLDVGEEGFLVAADGFRMSVVPLPITAPEPLTFLIPNRTVTLMLHALANGGDAAFTVDESGKRARLVCGGTTVETQTAEGTFPKWRTLIPKGATTECSVKVREMTAMTKIAAAFGENSIKRATVEALMPTETSAELAVSSAVSAGANQRGVLEASIAGAPGRIAFQAPYLLDALGVMHCERVKLTFSEAGRPGTLTPEDDSGFVHVLMPVIEGRGK